MSSQQSAPLIRAIPFQFTGSGQEYFKIWIVNLCLTILTVGIYSAWAKVRRLRYFYGNTWLDDHSFSFTADPVKILKGRILAVAFLVIYYLSWEFNPDAGLLLLGTGLVLFPFILVAAVAFQMRYSSCRNIRFYLDRDYGGAYRIFLIPFGIVLLLTWAGYSLLDISDLFAGMENEKGETVEVSKSDFLPTIFILAILPLIPYLDYVRTQFIISHTYYGQRSARFESGLWPFYRIYLISMLLFAIVMALTFIAITFFIFVYITIAGENSLESAAGSWPIALGSILIFYMMAFFVSGYLRARRTNLIYGNTAFDEMHIRSNLKVMPVSWIYLSNTVAILLSLGLLIPWAKIRMAHYVASCTELETRSLDDIAAASDTDKSALGEEMVDSFDIDIGL